MILTAAFHLWEYIYVAMFHPGELSWHSFLIDHSRERTIAGVASVVEYLLERLLFPSMKGWRLVVYLGFFICAGGQAVRTLAMYTAGSNFHHHIRDEKEENHQLVTWGVYSYLRHPAYFGWFWWAIGNQIVLMNPICIPAWGYAAWMFFKDRIPVEEETLLGFFPDDYDRYRRRTPVGIPGIK